MKKLMFYVFIAASIMPGGVHAAQQCFVFDAASLSDDKYTYEDDNAYGLADWVLTYQNVTIRGIGVCGHTTEELDRYSVSESVRFPGEQGAGDPWMYDSCYCKMISPVVSKAVFFHRTTIPEDCDEDCRDDQASCKDECAVACQYDFVHDIRMRTAMLNNLVSY